jgi:hypothetical protein
MSGIVTVRFRTQPESQTRYETIDLRLWHGGRIILQWLNELNTIPGWHLESRTSSNDYTTFQIHPDALRHYGPPMGYTDLRISVIIQTLTQNLRASHYWHKLIPAYLHTARLKVEHIKHNVFEIWFDDAYMSHQIDHWNQHPRSWGMSHGSNHGSSSMYSAFMPSHNQSSRDDLHSQWMSKYQ